MAEKRRWLIRLGGSVTVLEAHPVHVVVIFKSLQQIEVTAGDGLVEHLPISRAQGLPDLSAGFWGQAGLGMQCAHVRQCLKSTAVPNPWRYIGQGTLELNNQGLRAGFALDFEPFLSRFLSAACDCVISWWNFRPA
jgi:hypothetical protein